jgi:hypothetical protein
MTPPEGDPPTDKGVFFTTQLIKQLQHFAILTWHLSDFGEINLQQFGKTALHQ